MNKEREQLVQQLYELQKEVVLAQNNLRSYESAAASANRKARMTEITLKELEAVDQNAKVYRPIGRVFVCKTKENLVGELTKLKEEKESETVEYSKNKEHYGKKVQDLEKQLTEQIKQLKL